MRRAASEDPRKETGGRDNEEQGVESRVAAGTTLERRIAHPALHVIRPGTAARFSAPGPTPVVRPHTWPPLCSLLFTLHHVMSKTTQKATAGLNAPAAKAAMDPDLNTLFASSVRSSRSRPRPCFQLGWAQLTWAQLGPVVASSGFRRSNRAAEAARSNEEEKEESTSQDFSDTDEVAPQPFGSSLGKFDEEVPEFHSRDALLAQSARSTVTNEASPSKKRRRATQDAEVEDLYMQRLAREDFKEDSQRKKQKSSTGNPASVPADRATGEENVDTAICGPPVPQHEVLGPDTEGEAIDKAARTVFLGNVSSDAITSSRARRVLQKHLASFLPSLDHHDPPHKVETLRFRSTAFSSPLPKKAAFAKKNIMDATTKGTNAYALYSTQMAAREAPRQLNGKVVLNRHLRVDSVAHPAKVDHRRCVFVGNLDYFDDESPHVKEQRQRRKQPGDVEEGLWVHFSNAGQVENVRVIRDAQTRAGKGFAYVQFAVRMAPWLYLNMIN